MQIEAHRAAGGGGRSRLPQIRGSGDVDARGDGRLRCGTFVAMMQTADLWNGDDSAGHRR